MTQVPLQHRPEPKTFRERIGDTWYDLVEAELDVFNDVTLWHDNPRLLPYMPPGKIHNEDEVESFLRQTSDYDGLLRSIRDIGQMEPVYVWKGAASAKYLVLEGGTRVTVLRELERKRQGAVDEGKFRKVKAKILPPTFDHRQRAILLARIHVRGTGVRAWGRYIQARFVYENVTDTPKSAALMTISELASYMGKSVSWVGRLRDAYLFAERFVEHVDDPEDGARLAQDHFSTLEEISKATGFGTLVKENSSEGEKLREQVFDMVRKDVFKEYRDARFMKQFHDDPEKWALLLGGEKHAAHGLANELKAGQSGVKARIEALPAQVERAIGGGGVDFTEDDIAHLTHAVDRLESHVNKGVSAFRLRLRQFSRALQEASLSDIKQVTPDEYEELQVGLADFTERLEKHKPWS